MGWNIRVELDLTGRKETMAESGVREGDLVKTPHLSTRTDMDSVFGSAIGVPGNNTNPLHQVGHRQRGNEVGGVRGGPGNNTKTHPTRTDRYRGETVRGVGGNCNRQKFSSEIPQRAGFRKIVI